MSDDTATVGGVPLTKLTKAYIKIRETRAAKKAEFDAADKELVAQQERIRDALLKYCKDNEVESVKTAAGLFYRTSRTRYWTSDWESMHKFVLEHGAPDFLEKRLNQGVVAQWLEENPDEVPPGLNADTQYSIAVRKK
jgi:hypothetical protein